MTAAPLVLLAEGGGGLLDPVSTRSEAEQSCKGTLFEFGCSFRCLKAGSILMQELPTKGSLERVEFCGEVDRQEGASYTLLTVGIAYTDA